MLGGIDLGGTKIEATLFDDTLARVETRRIPTPTASYEQMLAGIISQLAWLDSFASGCPIGLATPGLIAPDTGKMLTANLPATGHTLATDIADRFGRNVPILKDSRAFALSEAAYGAAKDARTMVGLIIGTGVSIGHITQGPMPADFNGQAGEIGHAPISAQTAQKHGLKTRPCGCGQMGCIETYLAGPGLAAFADAAPESVFSNPAYAQALGAWTDVAVDLLTLITRAYDPEVIVLGGGIGARADMPKRLQRLLDDTCLHGTQTPQLRTAQGGDASGARGAAVFAARQVT